MSDRSGQTDLVSVLRAQQAAYQPDASDIKRKAEVERLLRIDKPEKGISKVWGTTLFVLIFFLGGSVVASAFAKISMSVVAEASVTIDGKRRPVQALNRGVVADVFVAPGDGVEQGQKVFTLDTQALQERKSAAYTSLIDATAHASRLSAEAGDVRRADDIDFSSPVLQDTADARVAEALIRQRAEFTALYALYDSKQRDTSASILELTNQLMAYNSSATSLQRQIALLKEEEEDVRGLLEKGLVPKPRLLRVQSTRENVESQLGSMGATISRTQQELSRVRFQKESAKPEREARALQELQNVRQRIQALEKELIALDEEITQATIFAPETGAILSMKYRSPGSVVSPGEVLMEIVPSELVLQVEANVMPQDIDRVREGADVRVQFSTIREIMTNDYNGIVKSVPTDSTYDEARQQALFKVVIALDKQELKSLQESVKLGVGIPANVFINGGSRTLLSYLTEPITKIFEKGLREE